jgi:hypothetical protein
VTPVTTAVPEALVPGYSVSERLVTLDCPVLVIVPPYEIATCTGVVPPGAVKPAVQDLVTVSELVTSNVHVFETELENTEAVPPETVAALAWAVSDCEVLVVEVDESPHVADAPAAKVDATLIVLVMVVGGVVLASIVMTSTTFTSYSVPIPVFVTVPPVGKVIVPLLTVAVPQALVTLTAHTGKLPKRKSLRTADTDCDDRVSSRKLAKQGVVPPANALVMSNPPSKKSGEARLLLL